MSIALNRGGGDRMRVLLFVTILLSKSLRRRQFCWECLGSAASTRHGTRWRESTPVFGTSFKFGILPEPLRVEVEAMCRRTDAFIDELA